MGTGRRENGRDVLTLDKGETLAGDDVEPEKDPCRLVEMGLTSEYTDEHGLSVSSRSGAERHFGDDCSSMLSPYMVV